MKQSSAASLAPYSNRNLGTSGAQWDPFVQGDIPACPESSSEARQQQSRSSALMVTAKRAQLLLASIYMVAAGGHSGQWRAGRRVTQSLGQLGKHDRKATPTPRTTAGVVLASSTRTQSPVLASPHMPRIV